MKNKIFAIILSCIALVASLCACNDPVDPPPTEPTHVALWGYQTGSLTALISAYNEQSDTVVIDYTHFGGELYENALDGVMEAGELPDLICVKPDALGELTDRALVTDVGALATELNVSATVGATLVNRYRYDTDTDESTASATLWAIPVDLESDVTAFGITPYNDCAAAIKDFLSFALANRNIEIA